ncbi:MAG: hypothetical protein U0271_08245 [Polyangiaceae bacterium]
MSPRALLLLSVCFSSLSLGCEAPEDTSEETAIEYCTEVLGTCASDLAFENCVACYRDCGAPCRGNASCGNTDFACDP